MVWSADMDGQRFFFWNRKIAIAMQQELDGYTVKLEYDGPYETSKPVGGYTTKDQNAVLGEEEVSHTSYHPDKANCTMYYMCEGERKYHMPCPSNLVFNLNENDCDWPEKIEGCVYANAVASIQHINICQLIFIMPSVLIIY
ncbi:uncharacterized protein LOC142331565 isoform X1 [Lycorma delicatula]|uniref:uncharacterized protein LOC142331565 isoform X1 n=1 Tax=Lycorma delicatula TaxID=130591 RepID=UPI003F516FEC